jgi:hypothetical protein
MATKLYQIGQYIIKGYITDNVPNSLDANKTDFSFKVLVINQAPVFLTPLEDLSVMLGHELSYQFPEKFDNER